MTIKVIKIPSLLVFIALGGCATVQVTNTARSSIEQRLLISSLERALVANGAAAYDEYTILILIHYTRSDMDSEWQERKG
jgi:hypothetical protein